MVLRPHLVEFIGKLKTLNIDLALWTGATTVQRKKELLTYLECTDLYEEDFVLCWGEMPGCRINKFYIDRPTKMIVIKPVCFMKQVLCGAYKHALLFDNDLEKSLGFSQHYEDGVPVSKRYSRLKNTDEEHIEISSFNGDPSDNELHPTEGSGAMKLFRHIHTGTV